MVHRLVAPLAALLFVTLAWPAAGWSETVVQQDRERIRQHLKEVEAELRSRDVSHLTPAERRARERNLDRLHRYWKAGVFPQNDITDQQTPIFIDREGRDCAVAHLMRESGWKREAREIASRENLKRLPNMQSPEVQDWVAQSGLTAKEATMIQPSYSPCRNCGCNVAPVCGDDGKTYLNECTADHCANVGSTQTGCCTAGDDPVGPGETDDPWGTRCDEARRGGDTGVDSDAGDAGDTGSAICSSSNTPDGGVTWADTGTADSPSQTACSLAAGDRHGRIPVGGWLVAAALLGLAYRRRR